MSEKNYASGKSTSCSKQGIRTGIEKENNMFGKQYWF